MKSALSFLIVFEAMSASPALAQNAMPNPGLNGPALGRRSSSKSS